MSRVHTKISLRFHLAQEYLPIFGKSGGTSIQPAPSRSLPKDSVQQNHCLFLVGLAFFLTEAYLIEWKSTCHCNYIPWRKSSIRIVIFLLLLFHSKKYSSFQNNDSHWVILSSFRKMLKGILHEMHKAYDEEVYVQLWKKHTLMEILSYFSFIIFWSSIFCLKFW